MINLGVIGCGVWGRNHVRVLSELDNVNLEIISDLNIENLKKLNKTYKVKTTKNYQDILNNKNIHAVTISSPSSTHYKLVKQALLANKHVLVEKPITLNSKEGESLVKLAKKQNKILMVGHIFRYNPAVLKLKDEIKKGTLGKIRFMYGSRMGLMTPRHDCGVIFDFALHDIDTFCYILGEWPLEVTAVATSIKETKHEDVGFITLKFRKGIVANIGVSWLTPKKIRDLWVIGDQKSAGLDYLSQELNIYNKGIVPEYNSFGEFKLMTKSEGDDYRPFIKNKEPLKEEIINFIKSIEKKQKPVVDGQIGVNAVKIIEACYQSVKEKRTIRLNQ
jgi:predicted dehydrogenase